MIDSEVDLFMTAQPAPIVIIWCGLHYCCSIHCTREDALRASTAMDKKNTRNCYLRFAGLFLPPRWSHQESIKTNLAPPLDLRAAHVKIPRTKCPLGTPSWRLAYWQFVATERTAGVTQNNIFGASRLRCMMLDDEFSRFSHPSPCARTLVY